MAVMVRRYLFNKLLKLKLAVIGETTENLRDPLPLFLLFGLHPA